jgi:hypothetical protein
VNAAPNRLIADHHPASMPTILERTRGMARTPKEIAFELGRPLNAGLLKQLS